MSWEYYVVPKPHGARFSKDALDAMSRWWDGRPTYRRSDGVIAVCRDEAYRDWVLASRSQDEPSFNVEHVRLAPERVTLSVAGWTEMLDALHGFLVFCQSHQACDVVDEAGEVITPDKYRERQRAVNHPPGA